MSKVLKELLKEVGVKFHLLFLPAVCRYNWTGMGAFLQRKLPRHDCIIPFHCFLDSAVYVFGTAQHLFLGRRWCGKHLYQPRVHRPRIDGRTDVWFSSRVTPMMFRGIHSSWTLILDHLSFDSRVYLSDLIPRVRRNGISTCSSSRKQSGKKIQKTYPRECDARIVAHLGLK